MVCIEKCEEIASKANKYLFGANLDKIVVYSIEIQLCFMAASDSSYVWVSGSGDCFSGQVEQSSDFFINRGNFIRDVYELIGRDVSNVDISADGTLIIYFGERSLSFHASKENVEISWSLTSDTPAPFEQHRFSIMLVEDNEIILKES